MEAIGITIIENFLSLQIYFFFVQWVKMAKIDDPKMLLGALNDAL